ncbi:hypothetical protein FKP32DRAFT_1455822 [Trametes sanguinea]|nr:hypothetical protein FKP32DRAFT_1455822 [Trametes sanguinea]
MPRRPLTQGPGVTADNLFHRVNQTADDLHRDIALLTFANAKLRTGDAYHARYALKDLSSDMRAKSAMLTGISTLLTTGRRATANAVTGRIDPDCVTLLCSANEGIVSDQSQTVIRKIPVDPAEGERLLSSWWDIPDVPECFNTHASQVASILAYIWGPGKGHSKEDIYLRFICFLLRRARSKIVERINYARTIWDGCPFQMLRSWYETHMDTVPSSTVEFPHLQAALIDLLAANGLHPEPDKSNHYNLSSSNILNWVHVLEKAVSDIEEAFGDTAVAPSYQQTLRANTAMKTLHALLLSNLGSVLQEHESCILMIKGYKGCGEFQQIIFERIGEAVLQSRRGDLQRLRRTITMPMSTRPVFGWRRTLKIPSITYSAASEGSLLGMYRLRQCSRPRPRSQRSTSSPSNTLPLEARSPSRMPRTS